MTLKTVAETTLYLLVMINPISKIFILSVLSREAKPFEMRALIVKASLVALLILLALGAGGDFVLSRIFHVQLYSLKVAGGIILFVIGYRALSKGIFFEVDEKSRFEDLSIVPLASPMIAGPAAITAAISLNTEHGMPMAALAIMLAVLLNFAFMRTYRFISAWMLRYHIMGALIRITGLIVAAMAVEMVFSGIQGFWHQGLLK